jgi:hypothetical protein
LSTVPDLSEAAQDYVDSCGGWLRYLDMLDLDPLSHIHVEAAREFAEYEAFAKYREAFAAANPS